MVFQGRLLLNIHYIEGIVDAETPLFGVFLSNVYLNVDQSHPSISA